MTIWLVHMRAEADESERQRCAHPKEARLLSCFASMTSTTLGRSTIRRYAFRSTIGKLGLPARLEHCFATRWLNFQGDGGASPVGAAFGLGTMSKSAFRQASGVQSLTVHIRGSSPRTARGCRYAGEAQMFMQRTAIGLGVHVRSILAAALTRTLQVHDPVVRMKRIARIARFQENCPSCQSFPASCGASPTRSGAHTQRPSTARSSSPSPCCAALNASWSRTAKPWPRSSKNTTASSSGAPT